MLLNLEVDIADTSELERKKPNNNWDIVKPGKKILQKKKEWLPTNSGAM